MRSAGEIPKTKLIQRIVRMYGLSAATVLPSSKGYRNDSTPVVLADGEMVNIIIYKREPGIVETIRRADAASDYIAERGLPARHTRSHRLVVLGSGDQRRYANVYDYLPGETIPWESYTKGHIKALGASLSALHGLLVSYDTRTLPNVEDVYSATLDRMSRYFYDELVKNAMTQKLAIAFDPHGLELYAKLLGQCRTLAHRHALHMDFVRGNILFTDEKVDGIPVVSGILDFEKVACGHPLFDVARTMAFLLVDCKYKTSDQVSKYFLDSGYLKRGSVRLQKITVNTGTERHDLLALLIDMFLLHDLYKFLRHNPYEFLEQNEHYIRTRNILLRRKLIQRVK